MSSVPTHSAVARFSPRGPMLLNRLTASVAGDSSSDVGFRVAVVQTGYWLGWASIAVVLASLAFDLDARHRWLLVGLTLAASAGNTAAMVIPWREWLTSARGRLLLDAWSGGLIAYVAVLVTSAGSSYTLLLFLVVPFIAVVQASWRRAFWLVASGATCVVVAAVMPLSASATAMRLMLVAVAAAVALVLAHAIRLEADAHRRAEARAEVERTLAKEANHRIKNDLQTAVDLLLLDRPGGAGGAAFDETADRIRSIATVHRLLTETVDRVDGGELLRSITAGAPVPVHVDAAPVELDAATAQILGIVANELVTNAIRHGAPPIAVRLTQDHETRLCIDDRGARAHGRTGSGLGLVQRLVEHSLRGRFELHAVSAGTRAQVVFPKSLR